LLADENRIALKILPLRCHIDQKVIHFVQDFFAEEKVEEGDEKAEKKSDNDNDNDNDNNNFEDSDGEVEVMERSQSFFQSANINSTKIMADYEPVGIDFPALRAGQYAELLNVFPLEELQLKLDALQLKNLTGWGSLFGEIFKSWIANIMATQMHKFVTSAPPINTLSNIGEGMADLILLPTQRYRKERSKGSIVKGIREGVESCGEKVGMEVLKTGKTVASLASNLINDNVVFPDGAGTKERAFGKQPRSASDSLDAAFASVSRGVSKAHSTVIAIPEIYKESRGDLKKTTKAAIRAVPICVLAPMGGGLEAMSYTMLGLRNELFPHKRAEEEAQYNCE